MKTDNELIAEFMGLPLTKEEPEFTGDRKLKTVPFQRWKYDSSWERLMPVVEKIDNLTPPLKMPEDLQALKDNTHPIDKFMEVTALPLCTPITEVYEKVVEFIKWYNSQSPDPRK